jgi:hypothetical protein
MKEIQQQQVVEIPTRKKMLLNRSIVYRQYYKFPWPSRAWLRKKGQQCVGNPDDFSGARLQACRIDIRVDVRKVRRQGTDVVFERFEVIKREWSLRNLTLNVDTTVGAARGGARHIQ